MCFVYYLSDTCLITSILSNSIDRLFRIIKKNPQFQENIFFSHHETTDIKRNSNVQCPVDVGNNWCASSIND